MTQWVRVLTAKPGDLSLIPEGHVDGKREKPTFKGCPLGPPHA